MTARYAIYYAPPADTPLWNKASAWLGRDAYTGQDLERPFLPGLEGLDLDALIADPRGYGFHATLKAPFELANGASEDRLLATAERFVVRQKPFEAAVAPAALGRFLAFQLQARTPEMELLHAACVSDFDGLRAPLSDHDLARRRKAPLTPEQDARLVAWGYPYVFEDFRFHMTLTGSIRDEAVRAQVLAALQDHFVAETGIHRFDGIAVFKQADRSGPFDILQRFDFQADALASA
jgi:putative phosphonate metabolism protein